MKFSLGLLYSSLASLFYTSTYDFNQMNIGVYLSGAAYCDKLNYNTMKLAGPASGFIVKDTLYDSKTDLQGYTGVLPSTKSIYVSFRGSSSAMNWMDDFEARKVDYKSWPDCKCQVHNGFYKATLNLKDQTISSVKNLQKLYPGYSVYVVGHSLGAAVAELISLELLTNGITSHVYNYGQPRVGDISFASYAKPKIGDYWRVTHNKDMVPHTPPTDVMNYYHSCGEVWEDSYGTLHTCSSTTCEDPKCADQFALYQTSTEDHSYYLDHRVSCEASTF